MGYEKLKLYKGGRTPKVWTSTKGRKLFDVAINHRCDKDVVIIEMASAISHDERGNQLDEPVSRGEIFARIKASLTESGMGYYDYGSDNLDSEQIAHATERAKKLFPEFF